LASRFGGDLASADWRHYGRLAGFTNRKDKYRRTDGTFTYVRPHEASGVVYSNASTFLAEVKSLYESEQCKPLRRASWRGWRVCRSNLKSIQEFRAKPVYAGDQTRVDLAYAVYALSHGVPENETRNALVSRDLVLYEHKDGEFVLLSKPLKTKKEVEEKSQKLSARVG
jgi:hypothetical protein